MNKGTGRVTLRTLAKTLGLSATTVSRALKGASDVNADTIERVRATAVKLGYRPNLGGVNLRTGKSQAVGVVVRFERQGDLNILTASLLEGVSSTLRSNGYRTILVPQLPGDDPLEVVQELVREGSVDGVIITHTRPQDDRVKFLLEAGMPFVTFGRTELLSAHANVDLDHEVIGAEAARLLLDAGHAAPLLFAPSSQYTYSLQFVKGWTKTFNARHLSVPDDLIHFSATTPNSGVDIARTILRWHPNATGAFVASDEAGLGFVAEMQSAGRRIGRDFGLLTYGGSNLHDFVSPPMSAFYYSNYLIGEKLAGLLHKAMNAHRLADLHDIVLADFIDHQSHLLRR
jgi:LacI family transcriptional regulator, galactose operon repressor